MASNINRFCIRYTAVGGTEQLVKDLNREEAQATAGRIIYAALAHGRKLEYIRICPCVKLPGTKVLWEMSRKVMLEGQLRHWCKVLHRKAYGC